MITKVFIQRYELDETYNKPRNKKKTPITIHTLGYTFANIKILVEDKGSFDS